ncbi:S-layer homology domain-containing protein [Paenibacillus filicis]|uniref:S-layer homology domain-containing protein n=1 Tax=Paenibacillus filicis TaxID=669464 RepID=A0ABU9DKL2_9BACL
MNKVTKGIMITVFSAVMGLQGHVNSTCAAFSDTVGHWAGDSIEAAVKLGYVDGYPDGSFRPDATISRAEFMAITARALQLPVKPAAGDNWYVPYLEASKKAGVYDDDFKDGTWNEPIPRQDMAKIAVRASGWKLDQPVDYNQWMWEATKAGLIHGVAPGDIAPEGKTTRAQSITVLNRILDVKSGKKLETDKYAISEAEIFWHKTNVFTMLPEYFLGAYKYNGRRVNTDNMKYTGSNGYCEVEKYVVIDMDDPHDPNRSLIKDNMRWLYSDIQGVYTNRTDTPTASYALLSVNHLVADLLEKPNAFFTCGVFVSNQIELKSNEARQQGKPYMLHNFSEYVEENEAYMSGKIPNMTAGKHDFRYISGQLLPKGDIAIEEVDRLYLSNKSAGGLGQNEVRRIYDSSVNYDLKR